MYGSSMHRRELLCNSHKCILLLYEHVLEKGGKGGEGETIVHLEFWSIREYASLHVCAGANSMQSRIDIAKEG